MTKRHGSALSEPRKSDTLQDKLRAAGQWYYSPNSQPYSRFNHDAPFLAADRLDELEAEVAKLSAKAPQVDTDWLVRQLTDIEDMVQRLIRENERLRHGQTNRGGDDAATGHHCGTDPGFCPGGVGGCMGRTLTKETP